jgi:hypothetical protein
MLVMTAKLKAHRGQQTIGEVGLASRTETLIKGRAQNRRGRGAFDGRLNRPAAFTRV